MTSSGIPTARGYLPAGTDRETCIAHNRSCKTARIVTKALELGYDSDLTDAQIDAAADAAGVRRPGESGETRRAVRMGLLEPLTDDDPGQTFAEATMAASIGIPFRYTDCAGHTVLLVPIPVGQ